MGRKSYYPEVIRQRISTSMKQALEREADRGQISVAELVRRCLRQCLERMAKQKAGSQ